MTNRSVREQLLAFHGVEDISQLQPLVQKEVEEKSRPSEIKSNPYGVVSRAWKMYQEARKKKQIENLMMKA